MPSDKVRSVTFDINDDNTVTIRVEVPEKKNKEGGSIYEPSKKYTAPNWDAAQAKATKIYYNGVEDEGKVADSEYKKAKDDDEYDAPPDDTTDGDGLKPTPADKSYKKMGTGSNYANMED